tara:strand:- start:9393 stop:9920 length:528 start_codon:yes stop_codon:yes gene_type:complete
MTNQNINFDINFLPIDIISSWKRASLSSAFCSNLLNSKETPQDYINNTLSTIINECLEFSIKHGVKKTEKYVLSCNKDTEETTIELSLYLISHQINLLKNYIKKIKIIKKNNEFENILFAKEFSELGYAIYSLVNDYKGKINIKSQKNKEKTSSILKTRIIIKLNNKDIKHDHQN